MPVPDRQCQMCESDDVEVYPAERPDEPDVLHCHECGHDQKLARRT